MFLCKSNNSQILKLEIKKGLREKTTTTISHDDRCKKPIKILANQIHQHIKKYSIVYQNFFQEFKFGLTPKYPCHSLYLYNKKKNYIDSKNAEKALDKIATHSW